MSSILYFFVNDTVLFSFLMHVYALDYSHVNCFNCTQQHCQCFSNTHVKIFVMLVKHHKLKQREWLRNTGCSSQTEPPDGPWIKWQLITGLTWETTTVKDDQKMDHQPLISPSVSSTVTELGTPYKSWFNSWSSKQDAKLQSEFVYSNTLNKWKITPFPRMHHLHLWIIPIQLPMCCDQFNSNSHLNWILHNLFLNLKQQEGRVCPLSAEPESKRNKLISGLLKSSQADAHNAVSCCARALPVQLNIRLHEDHGSRYRRATAMQDQI